MHSHRRHFALLIALLALIGVTLAGVQAQQTDPTPVVPPNVVGGGPVAPGDYPWLVGLLNASVQDEADVFCGGALIDDGAPTSSSLWVLTAAHCLVDDGEVAPPEAIEVLAGQQNLTQVQPNQRHPVEEVIVHPLYISGYALVNDVALLRLAAPVNVGATLRIATPADAARFAPGVDAQIAGWGNLLPQTGVQQPDIAHKAVVKIVDNATCNARYDRALGIEHLCAGIMPNGGVDTCQGDSGGPLMVPDGSGGLLHAGIVSFGQGCAWPNFPGVYARTATYADWIEAVINGEPHVDVLQTGPYAVFPPDAEETFFELFHISTAAPGEPFTYTLRIANTGMQTLSSLTITATLPANASLIRINDGGSISGNVMTWTAPNLLPGEVITRSYVVSSTTSVTTGPYGVTATSGSATVASSGRSPLTTLINEPRLHLRTVANPRVEVGSIFQQVFLLVNFGRGAGAGATAVQVRAALPNNANIVAIGGGADIVGNELRWQVPELTGGTFAVLEMDVRAGNVGSVFRITDYQAQAGSATPVLGATGSQTVATVARRHLPLIAR
ncbi:MAG: trypsin-like serine protease [Roseiflexus sp.]|nr:trypsin-like serine protease [Roseiflexus sp.]